MEWRIISEDELEIVNCPECGSDNVLVTSALCVTCTHWRVLLLESRPSLKELVHLT